MKYLTYLLVSIFLFSCSTSQKVNLANLEKKIITLVPETEAPDDQLPVERISIQAKDHVLMTNWVSAGETSPAFFIAHGNGEMLTEWRPLQAYLLSKGYSSFVFDYSGFGSSTGEATVANLNRDVLIAYEYFASLTPKASERIALGHSLGCSMLLEDANKFDPQPDKVVVHGAFASLRSILVQKEVIQTGEEKAYPDDWNGLKNAKKMKAPLYIIHSPNDKTIDISNGRELLQAAGSNGKFLSYEATGHNDIYKLPTDDTWNQFFEFISSK